MNSNRIWQLVVILVFLVFLQRIPAVGFHPDETLALGNSQLFNGLVEGQLSTGAPVVTAEKSLRNYMVGFTRYLGEWIEMPPLSWNWTDSLEANIEAGNLPSSDLLWWGRFGSVIAGTIAFVAALWFVQRMAGWPAVVLGLVFLLPNTFLRDTLGRVREDALILALVMLTAYLSFRALEKWERGAPRWQVFAGWLAAALTAGLAAAAKLTGGALALLPPALVLLYLLKHHSADLRKPRLWMILIPLGLALGLISFFAFTVVNPALVDDPFQGTLRTLTQRTDTLESQFSGNEGTQIDGVGDWLSTLAYRNFENLQTFKFPGALFLYLPLSLLGLVHAGRQARDWWKGDDSGLAAVVFLGANLLFCAASLLPLRTDWPRYYFPSVFFVLLLQGIGVAVGLGWLARRLNLEPPPGWLAAAGRKTFKVAKWVTRALTSPNVLVILILFLFLVTLIYPMLVNTNLFGVDPWRHYFFTRFGEDQQFFTRQVLLHGEPTADSYPNTLRSNMFLFMTLSGADAYTVTRFFTLLLRAVYLLLVYAVVQAFTGERRWALLGMVLAMTSYYFVWRSSQTWPENQVVLMYLLALWGFERHRRSRARRDLVLITLALIGASYTHPPSLYVFAFMLAGYGLLALMDRDWATLKAFVVVVLVGVLAAVPNIIEISRAFINTLTSNFGEQSVWAPIARQQSRYDPIEVFAYQGLLGNGMIAFAVLGAITLINERFRERLPLLVVTACGFVLTLSTHYSLYIPPNRTMGYFYIPLIPIAMLGAQAVFKRLPSYWLRSLFVGLSALAAFMMVFDTPVFDANTTGEVQMARRINLLLEENRDASIGFMGGGAVLYLLDYPSAICNRTVQYPDGHYNSQRALEGDDRCLDPTYIVVNLNDTRAVPGYEHVFEEGNYGLWVRRR